jgi:hypothetical protein
MFLLALVQRPQDQNVVLKKPRRGKKKTFVHFLVSERKKRNGASFQPVAGIAAAGEGFG